MQHERDRDAFREIWIQPPKESNLQLEVGQAQVLKETKGVGVARFRLICPRKETVNHRTIHARMGKTVLRLALNIIIDPKIRNLVFSE